LLRLWHHIARLAEERRRTISTCLLYRPEQRSRAESICFDHHVSAEQRRPELVDGRLETTPFGKAFFRHQAQKHGTGNRKTRSEDKFTEILVFRKQKTPLLLGIAK